MMSPSSIPMSSANDPVSTRVTFTPFSASEATDSFSTSFSGPDADAEFRLRSLRRECRGLLGLLLLRVSAGLLSLNTSRAICR